MKTLVLDNQVGARVSLQWNDSSTELERALAGLPSVFEYTSEDEDDGEYGWDSLPAFTKLVHYMKYVLHVVRNY